MLKKDKRYQDLAIKVATRMCKGHLQYHIRNAGPEGLITIGAIHMTLFPNTTAPQLRKDLLDVFSGTLLDYPKLIAEDDDFMEVLVDELGLALSDIDFDEAISSFRQDISDLVDEVVISVMEAERVSEDDYKE